MPADRQIHTPSSGTAPLSYTVANSQECIPRAVNATFDGTGAAGSFVPTLEVISDGGIVVARVPCQTTIAAGSSAEVTFAPFLRSESASGAQVFATWAGLYIDLSTTPLAVPAYPTVGYQAAPFNDLNAACFFRTDDSTMWRLFSTDRVTGDVSLVVHKGSNSWAFYAEAGCRIVPSGGGGFAGVDMWHFYDGIEIFLQYTGPDVSVDPASSTQETTAPQEIRGVWNSVADREDFAWVTRSSMWVDDNSAAGDDWTFTMDIINRSATNPAFDVYEAYLHVFAVPVTSGYVTTTLPIVP